MQQVAVQAHRRVQMPTTHYVPTILYHALFFTFTFTHFYHLIQMPGGTPQDATRLYGCGPDILQSIPAASSRAGDGTTPDELCREDSPGLAEI